MPVPDLVLELGLGVGNSCPEEATLERMAAVARETVPLGARARALAICSDRPGFNQRVLSVGVWANDEGDSEARLADALTAAGPLVPGRNAALQFSPAGLQTMASVEWRRVPKKIDAKIGFTRLNDTISVVIDDETIVTTVRGEHKIRFAPNISFKFTLRDTLALRLLGSEPPLEVESTSKFSPGMIKAAALTSLISPLLGGLVFWKGDDVASGLAPSNVGGAGGALAARWPPYLLTEMDPPDLSGKLSFLWSDLVVDDRGVRTLGAVVPVPRVPVAGIQGPGIVTAQLPSNSATVTYRLLTKDLRGRLDIRWTIDGSTAGRAVTQKVSFQTPGLDPRTITRRVQVDVTDEDGLTASHQRVITFKVTVPPGKQPF
jgi:hypothetical protein